MLNVVGVAPTDAGSLAFWQRLDKSLLASIRRISPQTEPSLMSVLQQRFGSNWVEFFLLDDATLAAAHEAGLHPCVIGKIDGATIS